VSAGQLEDIAAHVGTCRACLRKLDEFDRTNPPVIRSGSSTAVADPDDPALEQAIRRLLSPVGFPSDSRADPLMPGDRLGDYRLIEPIGEGGMGTTYKARHTRLEKTVALKVLRPPLAQDPASVARFRREMRAIGRLQHPNIVQATDAGEARGFLYLVMEFLDGQTLSQQVRKTGPLDPADACRVARDAARGLRHAHENGIVHRDVKPSNLIRTADGQVKLLDLGLALLRQPPAEGTTDDHSRLSDDRGVIGTNDYMAPEQWKCSSQVDARADQYSLGCTLYYLLVGRPPFARDSEDTQYDKMQAHLHLPAPAPSLVRPGVPPDLDAVVARLLAKAPADRFASMDEVIAALAPLAGEPADPVTPAPRPAGPARRSPGWALVPAVLIAGVAVAVFWRPLFGKAKPTPPAAEPPPAVTAPPTKVVPPFGLSPMTPDDARALQQSWADYLGRPVVERNSVGMELVLVPPGEFDLDPTRPTHRFAFTRPFELGQTEVTHAQFTRFVEEQNYRTTAELDGKAHVYLHDTKGFADRPGLTWQAPGTHDPTPEHPVALVSWDDADEFCRWLSLKEKRKYRLPTEWEFQWACRAGSDRRYPWGPDPLPADEYAWHMARAGGHPHPVGRLKPNPWGLYDMIGNVAEWCQNLRAEVPPGRHENYQGTGKGNFRAAAGGGWDTPSVPSGLYVFSLRQRNKWANMGFRVLREVPLPAPAKSE
jgi:formylglycine-generating enzyme required for sulfatase activity/tRNA A-37 threonylcarbamoyl transferase component Bud32